MTERVRNIDGTKLDQKRQGAQQWVQKMVGSAVVKEWENAKSKARTRSSSPHVKLPSRAAYEASAKGDNLRGQTDAMLMYWNQI